MTISSVELKTQSKSDRLILAKIPSEPDTRRDRGLRALTRLQQSEPGSMQRRRDLFIPVIDFDVFCDY